MADALVVVNVLRVRPTLPPVQSHVWIGTDQPSLSWRSSLCEQNDKWRPSQVISHPPDMSDLILTTDLNALKTARMLLQHAMQGCDLGTLARLSRAAGTVRASCSGQASPVIVVQHAKKSAGFGPFVNLLRGAIIEGRQSR